MGSNAVKKTESTVMYILRLSLILFLIAGVVALALAAVNMVTAPKIAQLQEAKTQEAIKAVLDGGYDEIITDYTDKSGLVSKIYKGANGYAVEVKPSGFDNTITMMVGIDNEGKVTKISVISHTETAGLGAIAADKTTKGDAFRGQFAGLTGVVQVTKDGGTVEAITGATITSRAVCDGVTAALAVIAGLG